MIGAKRPLPNRPSVTVLIVNWNTRELLSRCLDSLKRLPEYDELEVIVIDNASGDGSAEMVRVGFPDVLVIENDTNVGFASANNAGFRASSAPHVLLLNSDTEVAPRAISRARDHLVANPSVGVVGCRIEDPDGSPQNSVFRDPSLRGVISTTTGLAQKFPASRFLNHDRYGSWVPDRVAHVEVVMGSFLMVRRSDIEPDSILDDGYFMYSEEADLCRRLRRRGFSVDFVPDVSVMHVKGASSRTDEQLAWSDEAKRRAQLRFIYKWHGVRVAQLANAVMLVGLGPRVLAWLTVDALRGTRTRLKARSARFHLAAMISPERFDERFGPPPAPAH